MLDAAQIGAQEKAKRGKANDIDDYVSQIRSLEGQFRARDAFGVGT